MMEKHCCCFKWIVLHCILLSVVVSSNHHENSANDIVEIINHNRTALKLRSLNNSPGLGCMALQYAKECKSNCTSNNTLTCQPLELDFLQIFAPNCGVELPTFGTITGHIIGCQHKYLDPPEVFSRVLARDNKTLSLLRNKTHSEVGVGLLRDHHKRYYWCVLFSDSPTNSSFVLEDLGQGIKQKNGCFSGTGVSCSGGERRATSLFLEMVLTVCLMYFWVLF